MKKVLTAVILLTAIISITGCNKKSSSYLTEISFSELYEKIDNKDSFILEIFQDGCSHCSVFNPRFKAVLNDYEVNAFSLNFTKITEKEYEQFTSNFGSLGTPTVIFIENGTEKTQINRIEGEATKKEIIRKLKQNGYIEE